MKDNFFLFFLLVLSCGVKAQNEGRPAIVNWGEELTEPAGSRIAKIIAHTSNGYYALRRKEETSLNKLKIYLEEYDKKGKLKQARELDLKYKKKLRDFEDVIMLGGNLYLLTSFNNQAKQKNYLFAQRIKSKSFILDSHLQKVGEIDSKDKYREGSFSFKTSRDSTKLLIYNKLPYKNKQPEQFALRVFDNTFQEIWNKNIVLPYPDNQFSVEEYQIDKNGNVYILGLVYSDGGLIRSRAKANYQYTILAYTNNGQDKEEYNIRGEKILPLNPTLAFAKQCGMQLYFVDRSTYRQKENADGVQDLIQQHPKVFILPEGGTNHLAIQGCEEIIEELVEQLPNPFPTHLVTSVGTGGTISGLITGLSRLEKTNNAKVIGFSALKGDFLQTEVENLLKNYSNQRYANWLIQNDYHFGGYAKFQPELINFINNFHAEFGIPLDPIYTGKMMFGLFDLIEKGYFEEGSCIVAIHTGGLQGIAGFNERFGKWKIES